MKNKMLITFVVLVLLLAVVAIIYVLNSSKPTTTTVIEPVVEEESSETTFPTEETTPNETDTSTTTPDTPQNKAEETLGQSAGGNSITAYHFGNGDREIVFIGGIHGGYSWNTALVAFETIDWLKNNPEQIPDNVKVTVIPVLNPDGLKLVTGGTGKFSVNQVNTSQATQISGRFNANEVDLNRNFACEWQAAGTWQDRKVSGGSGAFSEPESQAIRTYVNNHKPDAVITWYSAAGGVYSSSCNNGISAKTRTLTNLYAKAAGYPAHEEFDYYEITGDMVNWLAGQGIPAISVLLTDRTNPEWTKNQAGIKAVLSHYAN